MGGMVDDDRIQVDANSRKLAAAPERSHLHQAQRIGLTVDFDEDAERLRREHARPESRTYR